MAPGAYLGASSLVCIVHRKEPAPWFALYIGRNVWVCMGRSMVYAVQVPSYAYTHMEPAPWYPQGAMVAEFPPTHQEAGFEAKNAYPRPDMD